MQKDNKIAAGDGGSQWVSNQSLPIPTNDFHNLQVGSSGENGEDPAHTVQKCVQSQALTEILEFSGRFPGKHPNDVVYFAQPIGVEIGCPLKIGFTRDIRNRMYWLGQILSRDIRMAVDVAPVAILAGGFDVEQFIHQMFWHLRGRGEWFRVDRDLSALVAEIRSLPIETIPFPNREPLAPFAPVATGGVQ